MMIGNRIITPAIMIGGSGSRLWPLSRPDRPKQFLRLGGNNSLFQDTVHRFEAPGFAPAWLLANSETLGHVTSQLDQLLLRCAGIMIEPAMLGTAAAIAAMAVARAAEDPDALILVAPADHFIRDEAQFRDAVLRAAPLAMSGSIVTFGITPTGPETGFGYIARGIPIAVDGEEVGYRIGRGGFREKPDLPTARQFVADGYFWNAGIFLFKASVMCDELLRHAPSTFAKVSASLTAATTRLTSHGLLVHPEPTFFLDAPHDLSIDVAVMEKTSDAVVVQCASIGWSDVGSLSALWEIAGKDEGGNAVVGDGLVHDARNVFIHSAAGRKTVAAHISDLTIVDTEDALIVLPTAKAQSVKAIVAELKLRDAPEVRFHRHLSRHWGEAEIDRRSGDGVVHVQLTAAGRITRHKCRSLWESWTVTSGEVTLLVEGDHIETLTAGETFSLLLDDMATIVAPQGARLVIVAEQIDSLETFFFADDTTTATTTEPEPLPLFPRLEVA